jgi:hypothetical protein
MVRTNLTTLVTIVIACLLLTSCATILTKKTYGLNIYSNETTAKVKVYDEIYPLPTQVEVERSDKDLELSLILDSMTYNYVVKTSPNAEFLYRNLIFAEFCPIAYGIDFTNNKRFYYGNSVYLNTRDSIKTILPPVRKFYHDSFAKTTYPRNKGELHLHLSLPHINIFQLRPENEGTKSNAGFWGVSVGADYYHRNNQFINLSASLVSDFFVPVPAAVDIWGEYELMSSLYSSLSNNHKIGRLHVGYGFSYSKNVWNLSDHGGVDYEEGIIHREPINKSSHAFGLIFPIYFQIKEPFSVGVIYRPTFFRPELKDKFRYEHLISIDFAWKIRLKK